MKNQRSKQNKGITLIILVVTVIVLIILSWITLSLTLGEGGIIQRTRGAGESARREEAREGINLILSEWSIVKRKNTMTFEEFLQSKVESGSLDEWSKNGDETYTLVKNKYAVIASNDGLMTGETEKIEENLGAKVTFDSNIGRFASGTSKNVVKYEKKEVNKKQNIVKHLYTDTFNENGEQIDTTSEITGATVTKTARIEGASKLKISIKHGKLGTLCAIKSVPQAEPPLWQASSINATTEEFEIEGDTVNIFFGGGLGGLNDYYGYYATITGYDSNDNIIQEETGDTEEILAITEGNYENPTMTEGRFDGWFLDKECTKGKEVKFDESGIIQSSTAKTVTVYAKWITETFFEEKSGHQFQAAAMDLTATDSDKRMYGIYAPVRAKHFRKSTTMPDNSQTVKEIQTKDSLYPIYLWYDSTTQTLLWYCKQKPKMTGSTSGMLYRWEYIETLDLTGIDMSALDKFIVQTNSSGVTAASIQITFDETFTGTRENIEYNP